MLPNKGKSGGLRIGVSICPQQQCVKIKYLERKPDVEENDFEAALKVSGDLDPD